MTGSEDAAPPTALERVDRVVIASYALPTVGVGLMFFFVLLYMMIFATDVLLISPAAIGAIYGLSRIWDAISDPIAGFLSDRTQSRLGRRRPWMLAAVPAIVLSFGLMWNPPVSWSVPMLTLWMAATVFGFFTAMTIFIVPHQSLGAELTTDHHERSRVFAYRHVVWSIGSIIALGLMQWLMDLDDPRAAAGFVGWIVAIATGLLIIWAVTRLRERPSYQGRGASNPFRSYADVWSNKHARLLLAVFLIESLGGATIGVLTPYVARYIIGRPDLTGLFILAYMVPTIASTPVWPVLARRFGKRNIWLVSMVVTSISFGGMSFIGENTVWLVTILAAIAGTAAGCGSIMSPSIQSDVIDYDEYETGERKEGAYFAAWNFTYKSATGVTVFLTGVVLQWSGFVPNVEQTPEARAWILGLYSLFPFVCYLIGTVMFSRFSFDAAAHGRIRAELDRRAQEESS